MNNPVNNLSFGVGDKVLVGPSCGLKEKDFLLTVTAVRSCAGWPKWVQVEGTTTSGERRSLHVEAAGVHRWEPAAGR